MLKVALSVIAVSGSMGRASVLTATPVSDRDGFSVGSAQGPYVMRSEAESALIVGQGFDSQTYQWRAAMEFDIGSVGGAISNATLTYTFAVVANPVARYVVHGYAGNGAVEAPDLVLSNPITGTLSAPNTFPPPTTRNVTSYVRSLVDADERYAGFLFSGFADGRGFALLSSADAVYKPTLTVTYVVPEPAVLAGVGLLVWTRRHRGAAA